LRAGTKLGRFARHLPTALRRPTIRPFILPPIAAVFLLLASVSCDLRRDGGGTLARVRDGTMRVGVVEHRPWTTVTPGGAGGGIEGALVAEVARDLRARIEWVQAPESQLLRSLELGELDVVIGGLTDDNPWKWRVAFTKPIYTDTIVVGGPPGTRRLHGLAGATVGVRIGDPAGAYVRKRGGRPWPVADIGQVPTLVAAPMWQLPGLGFVSSGVILYEARHVIAVAPGDGTWRATVEGSLARRTPMMPEVLRMPRP
jgi:polar amino acid transport system substrate-binding protein